MGKRGPRSNLSGETTEFIGLKVPLETKQRLVRLVHPRKAITPSLPLSYGLSEYIRELIALHLASINENTGTGRINLPGLDS